VFHRSDDDCNAQAGVSSHPGSGSRLIFFGFTSPFEVTNGKMIECGSVKKFFQPDIAPR
jgi:hypothetical protein